MTRLLARGFTLIEMAVALFVIALLLGGILVPLTTRVEQKQISDTQKMLDEIRDALMGHAIAFGYLPCPDTTNDGAENVNALTGLCASIGGNGISHGNLPWQSLGLANSDVWGNRFRYAVEATFAQRAPAATFSLATVPDIRVCPAAAGCGGGSALTSSAVAIVISHGKNGFGATNSNSGAVNPAPTSADELENTDVDREFVSRIITPAGTAAGEFDDIVIWLSQHTLLNRMVAAGKLP